MRRSHVTTRAVLSAIAAASSAPLPALAQASFTGLGLLPETTDCYPRSISADGLRVSGSCASLTSPSRAFRWTAGVLEDLGIPPGTNYSEGGPLNTDGSVVAGVHGPTQRPYRWTQASGTMQDLGFPPGTNHLSIGMSADGSVISGFGGSSPVEPRVYRWTPGTGAQYLALPLGYAASVGGHMSANGNVIVGTVLDEGSGRPVIWTSGVPTLLPLLPGDTRGDALAVSADGLVVTGWMGPDADRHMFRWSQAGGVENLGGIDGFGRGINADGSVIVGWVAPLGTPRAVLWSAATGLVELQPHLTSLGADLTGWILTAAYSVSADGRVIVGQGIHNGFQEGWIAKLPAPCYANCDASATPPLLNANDFVCFLNSFVAQQPYANCDGSTTQPTLTANDFQCFVISYATGCT
jgi:uncharacterized membrane protein